MSPKKLNDLRKEIDKIDSSIVKLLDKRGSVSHKIGEVKKAKNQPIYSPEERVRFITRSRSLRRGRFLLIL